MSAKCVFRVASSGLVEGVILRFDAVVSPVAIKDGLKLVVSLSYLIFKSLRIRDSFLPRFEKEGGYEKELYTYSLNKQIYNRLIKTC